MTISLAKASFDLRPREGRTDALRRAGDWRAPFVRATEEKRTANPDRSSIRGRRSPPRLVWAVIVAFYLACALAMIGAPSVAGFDMLTLTSP